MVQRLVRRVKITTRLMDVSKIGASCMENVIPFNRNGNMYINRFKAKIDVTLSLKLWQTVDQSIVPSQCHHFIYIVYDLVSVHLSSL